MNALVTSIQRFCMHDGEGLRTTVFLKGCPLSCRWCHNPETHDPKLGLLFSPSQCISCEACKAVCPGSCHTFGNAHNFDRTSCIRCMVCSEACPTGALRPDSHLMDAKDIIKAVSSDLAFYGTKGGMTISGGEPLIHSDFVLELEKEAKAIGLTTDIETCGFFEIEDSKLKEIVNSTSTFLFDIKDTDSSRHRLWTGVPTEPIIENLRRIDQMGGSLILRCIIIHGINDNEAHYRALRDIFKSLSNAGGLHLIPFHPYADSKYQEVGKDFSMGKDYIPSAEELEKVKSFLEAEGIHTTIQ